MPRNIYSYMGICQVLFFHKERAKLVCMGSDSPAPYPAPCRRPGRQRLVSHLPAKDWSFALSQGSWSNYFVRIAMALIALLCIESSTAGQPPPTPSTPNISYVGNQACATCHAAIYD